MYCLNCGSALQDGVCANCSANAAKSVAVTDLVGLRIGAFLIDVVPVIILGVIVGWIPIVGPIIMGIVSVAYWLCRDIGGASIGKMILGLKVVMKDGSESTTSARILRNAPIAAGPALLIIPFAGYILGPLASIVLMIVEIVFLITKKERWGDTLANTTVVRKVQTAYVPNP